MANERDPVGAEPRAILAAADFEHSRILEVGCGDGRLTLRYAKASPWVVGIDTARDEVLSAATACDSDPRRRVTFLCASATALPFHDETFHIALFASSL